MKKTIFTLLKIVGWFFLILSTIGLLISGFMLIYTLTSHKLFDAFKTINDQTFVLGSLTAVTLGSTMITKWIINIFDDVANDNKINFITPTLFIGAILLIAGFVVLTMHTGNHITWPWEFVTKFFNKK